MGNADELRLTRSCFFVLIQMTLFEVDAKIKLDLFVECYDYLIFVGILGNRWISGVLECHHVAPLPRVRTK